MVMDYELDSQGLVPGRGKRVFFAVLRLTLGHTQPHIQWVRGGGGGPVGLKWLGHECNHLPSWGAEIKNGGAIPSLPHMSSLHGA
jgi:hypothetical protein